MKTKTLLSLIWLAEDEAAPANAIKAQQLRDPGIFEENGRAFQFDTVGGERGIAMEKLTIHMKKHAVKRS